jgi:hypothetical protein
VLPSTLCKIKQAQARAQGTGIAMTDKVLLLDLIHQRLIECARSQNDKGNQDEGRKAGSIGPEHLAPASIK